jgi:hypothetical protein
MRLLRRLLAGLIILFILIQLVPFGRDHTNPPVVREPTWNSPQTRALAVRACYDCHSNETRWLWFHNVAPISWGVQQDVNEGRATLNFSRWDVEQKEAEEAAEVVSEGEMPPFRYVIAHPEANLSDAEHDALVQGLLATLGGELDEDEDD